MRHAVPARGARRRAAAPRAQLCSDAPVIGHWPADLADALVDHIEHDPRRSVRGWAQQIGALPIATPERIANVNTPEDLAAL
ncbi:hypothetical protein MOP88_18600 [Sphingomonas sp. WKB10]|nr:hypothetical protein [Sphingomonas sp. WKB10]